jgi:heme oxygenase (biliverdin-IX-beta and delta-forming)
VQDIRAKLRSATAEEHRRTEVRFAAILATLSDSGDSNSYAAFLQAHARAFPAIGRALSAGLDWPAWRARWHDLEADLAALDLDPPPALHIPAATSRAEALGMAYVLEGSRLGSTLLLKSIPAGLPAAYLNGGNDRAPWRLLLGLLETIDPAHEAAAIAGARTAFGAFRAAASTSRVLEPAS